MVSKQKVKLQIDFLEFDGFLTLPPDAIGMVIFAHGSGSSHLSPRNNFVAQILNQKNIGTLLFDLLTPEEDLVYENRFDIDLLTQRLMATTNWLIEKLEKEILPIGYFGSSTGTAAALKASIAFNSNISAVVSRGGRPDLISNDLKYVTVPLLLIVGGEDPETLFLNQKAFCKVSSKEKNLKIIPSATHLFEEPGALEQAAEAAATWFEEYLCLPPQKEETIIAKREELDE